MQKYHAEITIERIKLMEKKDLEEILDRPFTSEEERSGFSLEKWTASTLLKRDDQDN